MAKITTSAAPIRLLLDDKMSLANSAILVGLGVVLISLLAQVAIPLPWTVVPITGQTFGVTLVALLYGRKLAVGTIVLYMGLGAFGLPIFAMGKSGFGFGPTMGYLVGMVLATMVVGFLSDRGWTKTFMRAWLAGICGSGIVFICGLLVLSYFVPRAELLAAGLIPFLPGDFIKTILAASIAHGTYRACR